MKAFSVTIEASERGSDMGDGVGERRLALLVIEDELRMATVVAPSEIVG